MKYNSTVWPVFMILIVWCVLGCGKTTLTVAAIRDPEVRRYFQCIAWQAVSQTPNILEIQSKLFMQLFGNKLPDAAATDVGLAFKKLHEKSRGQTFLVVLDDVSNVFNEMDAALFFR